MKCPVCDSEIKKIDKCRKCGFEDIRTEFINAEELEMWQKYVVYPCRFAYQTAVAQTQEMQKAIQKELKEIKKLQKESEESVVETNNGTIRKSEPTFKKLKTPKKDGWNTSGNIVHKNFYETYWGSGGITRCEINNIVIDRVGNKATVHFFAKKAYDRVGANATTYIAFKWKLKDDYGIVVADGSWANDKLNLGDVTKGAFSISGLDATTEYVLELVNS
jgi:hypothetical protein